MLNFIRSSIYFFFILIITPPLATLAALSAPLSRKWKIRLKTPWVYVTSSLVRHILGIRYQVIGTENILPQGAVILSQHQSVWETIVLQQIFPNSVYVWKKEIMWVPFFGWGLAAGEGIPIDRSGGMATLKHIAKLGTAKINSGLSIIIFPEGTRMKFGQTKPFQIGGAFLAQASQAPIIPVALNSGRLWHRKAFIKKAGMITISIGKPIYPQKDLSPKKATELVQNWIYSESERISQDTNTPKIN